MRKKSGQNELVLLESGFLLREIFADNYEYEAYFRLINSIELNDYFPSEFGVEFEEGGKSPRLKYPKGNPDVVVLVIPIERKADSPKKRSEMRQAAFKKYGGLIPKIRLEMKDELVMRKRLLAPDAEKTIIEKMVEQERKRGIRRLKKNEARNLRGDGLRPNRREGE
ncbi:MAG: hypothetical protein KF865_11305 [Bdellovibrionaceae bacterium]|nr:hypothetical protein [Pseudobdellovibrionaceae bacterium]